VSQLNDAVAAVPDVEKIGLAPPSSRTVHVIVPVPPVSLMATGTVPLTVSPSAGPVKAALMLVPRPCRSWAMAVPQSGTSPRGVVDFRYSPVTHTVRGSVGSTAAPV